ncbi:hypothetical protein OG874_07445 [Nocardia sp. NBC_00565]|uniref:hypothetical protein n=1 Tax=Nocardia sp. NBC_00565 TaxID=2975993 RepID=UPI002E7FC15B|nr:hypothetical protein [Nocardia sp. NBC_00565]WUC04982.1 hypothetical protein OG874_07445 [Nocardia sp. NBC_00565]
MSTTVQVLFVVVAVLVGIVVAVISGILSKVSGSPAGIVIRDGGVAFAGTAGLTLLLLKAIGVL